MIDLIRLMSDDGPSKKPILSREYDFRFRFKDKNYGARLFDISDFPIGELLPDHVVGFWGPGSTVASSQGHADGYQELWGVHLLLSDPARYMDEWCVHWKQPWGSFRLKMEEQFLRDKLVFYEMFELP